MQLLYGTWNMAKLESMRKWLAPLDVSFIGLKDLSTPLPDVDESGNHPLENARIKARAYFHATGMPVFSCDSGLYFEGVPEAMQPGVHVRNVNGKRLDDEEMIAYYGTLVRRMGKGALVAQYQNAICLIMGQNEEYTHMSEDIAGEIFLLTDTPHAKRTPGYPLDSLSVERTSGKYYYDLEKNRQESRAIAQGFRAFFVRALGLPEAY